PGRGAAAIRRIRRLDRLDDRLPSPPLVHLDGSPHQGRVALPSLWPRQLLARTLGMPRSGLRCCLPGRRRLLCAVQSHRFIHSLRKLWRLDLAEAKPMMLLPWRVQGARLQMPRDLQIAYTVGRMGIVTIADTYALWYGSPHTARFGFGRLVRLGLLRSFPRTDPLAPAWYSLTPQGLEWAAEQAGCDERELRSVAGIRRMHLPSMRNQLWTSVVLAC